MILQIIFILTMYPVLFLFYIFMKDGGKVQNGYCFDCRVKMDWMKDVDAQAVVDGYRRRLKRLTWLLALLPLTTFLVPWFSIRFSIWMMWLLAVIVLPFVPYAQADSRIKALKKEKGWTVKEGASAQEEEDTHWRWGVFYYNKNDKHSIVNKRNSSGTTMNLATTAGKVMTAIGIIGMLLIPASCVWVVCEEFAPMSLAVQEQVLVAEHLGVEYEIPFEAVEDVTLIDELPRCTKLNGTGMEKLYKGTFRAVDEGKCQMFLNPQNDVFLRIEAEGVIYYMSAADDEATKAIYGQLAGK